MNASERRSKAREVAVINRRLEDRFLPGIRKTIKAKVDRLMQEIREGGLSRGMSYLSMDLSNPDLAKKIEALYISVGLRHARRQNRELRTRKATGVYEVKRLGFNLPWTKFIKDYLGKYLLEKILFEVNKTTRDTLIKTVQEALDKGWGIDETLRRLEGSTIPIWQSARIVRTEVNRATNVGAMAAGATFEFEQVKEWIAAKDNRTRGNPVNGGKDHANHWSLDGITVDEFESFTDPKNGDKLRFPGDPEASAASTVNCRCHVAVVAKTDANGRLIPKRQVVTPILGINRPPIAASPGQRY